MPLIPVRIQRKLVQKSKNFLILGNRVPVLRFTGLRVYDLMRFVIRKRFASVTGVRAVYLCHGLASGECYPGLSDFDLVVVFDSPDPLPFYARMLSRWGSLKRYFPIADLSILSVMEFAEWQTAGGGWDPLDEVRHWQLLAGEELRSEKHDPAGEAPALDRMQWALGHFQNLLNVVIKEEQRVPFMALIARRQLQKCFWNAVLALNPKYLAIRNRLERIESWIGDHGLAEPVAGLQEMSQRQFVSGPVTTLRFSVAALAYQQLDASLAENPLLARPLYRPPPAQEPIPISNHAEVEERAGTMSLAILEMLEEKISSIMLGSTGTLRGYAFYIVLCDDLSAADIMDALRDIRAVFRVFDDAWFNAHFPAGIPVVCSPGMFRARLQTSRSSLDYFEQFRCVLFGSDPYAEATRDPHTGEALEQVSSLQFDRRREQLLYSLHLHQVYLGRYKPALHDFVTFYFPRLLIQRESGAVPATAEMAVKQFARLVDGEQAKMPCEMLEKYHGKDIDQLLRTMDINVFDQAWPLLRQGVFSGPQSA